MYPTGNEENISNEKCSNQNPPKLSPMPSDVIADGQAKAKSSDINVRDYFEAKKQKEAYCENKKSSFKATVRTHWEGKQEHNVSYGKSKLNSDQLMAIDGLARTIFGEMRGCLKNGERYLYGVARVILNRADYIKKHGETTPFVKTDEEEDSKNSKKDFKNMETYQIATYVMEASKQFSSWNPDDNNLEQILCVTRSDKAWKKSVQIATEAVMNPADFNLITRKLDSIYHYTSNIKPNWKNYLEINPPEINGSPLDNKHCIRFWVENKNKSKFMNSLLRLQYYKNFLFQNIN